VLGLAVVSAVLGGVLLVAAGLGTVLLLPPPQAAMSAW